MTHVITAVLRATVAVGMTLLASGASARGAAVGRVGFGSSAGAPQLTNGFSVRRFGAVARGYNPGLVGGRIGGSTFGRGRNYYPAGGFGPFFPYGGFGYGDPGRIAPQGDVGAQLAPLWGGPRLGPPTYYEPGYRAHPVIYRIEPSRSKRSDGSVAYPRVRRFHF